MDGAWVKVKEVWVKATVLHTPKCYTKSQKPQCMIKIGGGGGGGGRGGVVTPLPYKHLLPLPIPYL